MILIIAIVLLVSNAIKTAVYTFDAKTKLKDNYSVKNVVGAMFTQCNVSFVMGGYGSFKMTSMFMRNYQLPPHYKLYLDVIFYRIDSWDADYLNIMLDGQLLYSQSFSYGTGANLCGLSTYDDEIINIQVSTKHTNNYAVLQFSVIDVNNDNNESWGINQITLSIEPCPVGCDYCDSDSVQECNQWSLQYWDLSQNQFIISNVQLYQIYLCNQLCQFTIPLPQHTDVIIRFGINIPSSYNIKIDIMIDHLYNITQYFNGSSVFQMITWTNISSFAHSRNLINVQMVRNSGSYTLLYIKEFQLLVKKQIQQSNQLFPGCQTVIENTCWDCDDYLTLDDNEQCIDKKLITQINQINKEQQNGMLEKYFNCEIGLKYDNILDQCVPICGDSLIIYPEQCDDGNDIPFDSCYNCQFVCNQNCNECNYGVCQSCQFGYYLDSNSSCKPQCGNGVITPYLEQCDDGNDIKGDGCFDCQFECYSGGNQVKCLECETGLQVIDKQCIPICGDQIIIPEYEDCDDGNDIEYDGCFLCRYSCNKNCSVCNKGVCLDVCEYGEILLNQQCKSLCGNQIITGSEQCDDGNTLEYDGCHECQYSCPLNCQYCEKGQCQECQKGYQIEANFCFLINNCGNGELEGIEECDDGNTFINDGCYVCQIEKDWICLQQGECSYQQSPIMILTYLNQSYSTQFIQITFSQEIYVINQQLSKRMQIRVLNLDQFQTVIYPKIEASSELSYAEYEVSIEILQYMNEKPILEVNLNADIANEHNKQLENQISYINLKIPSYQSSEQKQKSESLSKVNQYLLINVGIMGFLALFSETSSICQEILILLQYYSYLKYINIGYPSNLVKFLESTKIVSVSPLLKLIHFPDLLKGITNNQIDQQDKFSDYSTDLISNLSSQVIQLLSLILLANFIKLTQTILYRQSFIDRYFNWMKLLTDKYGTQKPFTISKGLYFLINKFLKSSKLFTKEGLETLFIVNSQDLTFKALLSLYYYRLDTIQDFIQISLSGFIIISQSYFILNKLSTMRIEIILMIKNYIFFSSLVFCQNNETLQAFLIIFSNNLNFIILKSRFSLKMNQNIITLSVQAFVTLFTLTSIIYLQDLQGYISQELKLQIGWFHMAVLMSGLTAQSLKFMIPKIKTVFNFFKQQLEKCKQKKQPTKSV